MVLGVKIIQNILDKKKKYMTNKVVREKSHCIVCQTNKSRFVKQ